MIRVVDDVRGGELEHDDALLLQFVSPPGGALAFSIGGMAESTADLHDDRSEHEVDPEDLVGGIPERHLALGTWQAVVTHDAEKAAFQERLAPRIEQQFAHQPAAVATCAAQLRQPTSKRRKRGEAESNRLVDRCFDASG